MKPGYKTTEFWTMVGIQVINLLNITGIWDWISNYHSGVFMFASAAVYKVARGLAKAGVLRAPTV